MRTLAYRHVVEVWLIDQRDDAAHCRLQAPTVFGQAAKNGTHGAEQHITMPESLACDIGSATIGLSCIIGESDRANAIGTTAGGSRVMVLLLSNFGKNKSTHRYA